MTKSSPEILDTIFGGGGGGKYWSLHLVQKQNWKKNAMVSYLNEPAQVSLVALGFIWLVEMKTWNMWNLWNPKNKRSIS